jgi:hypothetical protein
MKGRKPEDIDLSAEVCSLETDIVENPFPESTCI